VAKFKVFTNGHKVVVDAGHGFYALADCNQDQDQFRLEKGIGICLVRLICETYTRPRDLPQDGQWNLEGTIEAPDETTIYWVLSEVARLGGYDTPEPVIAEDIGQRLRIQWVKVK